MMEAPSGSSGSAFCMVKRRVFTWMLKIESKSASLIVPSGAYFAHAGIGKQNIELAFFPFDLCEKAIQIAKVGHVSGHRGYIFANFFYRCSQLRFTASVYEDVRAFIHKSLRRRQANAAIAASNQCDFFFEFTHISW